MMNKIFQTLGLSALVLTSFFALALNVDAQSKKDQKKAKQFNEQGDKAFGKKDYRTAIGLFTQAVTLVPNNGHSHFWKGYAHSLLKENDLALTELDLALSQKYNPIEVYRVRWSLNYEKKNYDAALEDIKQILKVEPNGTDYLVALGEIYLAKGAFREALGAYQKAILKFPNSGDLFYQLARVQFSLGDTPSQAAAAEDALKKRTQYLGDAYFLLGDARQKQKKFPEAIDAYQRAILSKPDIYAAYRNLAELYRASSRFKDAIEISKQALKLSPNDGSIYTDLSWYYSLDDQKKEAAEAAQAGIRFLPDQYLAYTNLCRAYNDLNKPEMAIAACNNSLRLNPNDGETHFYLGRSNALLGKHAEAAKYYKLAVIGLITFTANYPDYSDGFYLLGNAYWEDNRLDKAVEAYRKCLELNPRFVKARFNLGYVSVIQRNRNGALEQYNSLLNLDKNLAAKLKAEIDKL